MKNKKSLSLCILLLVLLVALVACVDKPQPIQLTELTLPELADNQMVVIISHSDKGDSGEQMYTYYVVTLGAGGTDAQTCEGVINYLQQQGGLQVEWVSGDYGKYVNSIGKAVPTAANEYVEAFTSVTKDMGTWAGATTLLVGDSEIEIVSAAVGVTEMTVEPGAVIYFQVSSY